VCIERTAGGSVDPQGWATCTNLRNQGQSDLTEYYKCVYEGYNAIVNCFTSFCNQDTTNIVVNVKAAQAQYADLANPSSQPASGNPTTDGQTPGAQPGTTPQDTTQPNQTGNTQPSDNVTTTKINNDNNSGATSNKITKIFVGFLALSALAMNFV